MAVIGRICNQFVGILRTNHARPAFLSDQPQAWNVFCRLYSRKSNIAKREKKAQLRALAKQEKRVSKTLKIVKPFPTDPCADKEPSTDDVWFQHLHPFKQLTFEEAIAYHRESVHETVYNEPGAFVNIVAVLNLTTKKQNTFLDKLKGSYMPAHIYPTGTDVRVLALCKEKEDIEEALEAGAYTAGGLELIKSIEEGNVLIEEYDMVVAHTDVMVHLAPIRGLMKTKMPRANQGTLGRDMTLMVTKVKESKSYNLIVDSGDHTAGWVNDTIGKLNMSDEQLKENLSVYLEGILKNQPRVEDTPFVKELYVRCASNNEVFLLDRSTLLKEEIKDLPNNKKELNQSLISQDQDQQPEPEPVEAVQ